MNLKQTYIKEFLPFGNDIRILKKTKIPQLSTHLQAFFYTD